MNKRSFIQKTFDKAWQWGFIYKPKTYGIQGELLKWFESYLKNRVQRIAINGFKSDKKTVLAGVPQGSVLRPFLFLIYISDIICDVDSNIRLLADNTSLCVIIDDPPVPATCFNKDPDRISQFFVNNK